MSTRGLVILSGVVLLLIVGAFLMLPKGNEWTARARRDWKDDAIAAVERRLAGAAPTTTRPVQSRWADGDVLFMQNGDWIACESICRKEQPHVADLFVGRGSDGRWYYSTFHFCVGRTVLQTEPQPESLAQFAKAYWLEEFDGKSDRALQPTWRESDPWGAAQLAR